MPELGLGNRLNSESSMSSGIVRSSDYWVEMDGDADYVSLPSSFNSYFAAKDWSVSAWVYHTGATGTIFSTGHLSSGNSFRFRLLSDKIAYYYGNTSTNITNGSSGTALTDNTWYHVGITHEDSAETIKLYIDGSVSNTYTSQNVPGVVHDTNARIGSLSEVVSSEFQGRVANVAIFSDLVTPSEMASLATAHSYDATSIGNCVGWWRMGAGTEAGSGSTIYDMSANDNNGTLNGNAVIQQGTIS